MHLRVTRQVLNLFADTPIALCLKDHILILLQQEQCWRDTKALQYRLKPVVDLEGCVPIKQQYVQVDESQPKAYFGMAWSGSKWCNESRTTNRLTLNSAYLSAV
jgi:hypothetical protein